MTVKLEGIDGQDFWVRINGKSVVATVGFTCLIAKTVRVRVLSLYKR